MRAYLEHFPEQGGPAKRVEISKNPFVIGRSPTADLTIYSHKVSKDHALIAQDSGRYLVRDLRSTNGTFANGKRIDEVPLADGDIIHVAHWEFCFCLGAARGWRAGQFGSGPADSEVPGPGAAENRSWPLTTSAYPIPAQEPSPNEPRISGLGNAARTKKSPPGEGGPFS